MHEHEHESEYEHETSSRAAGARKRSRSERRPPPPPTRAWLEGVALRHLDRYPTSREGLRRALGRRADRSCAHHGADRAAAEAEIAAVLDRMTALGLLDDLAYARALVRRLRARGASTRRIAGRLHEKGIASETAQSAVGEGEALAAAELEAARTYARRRRLGVHRTDAARRDGMRERDLAALARAGFGLAVARAAIEAGPSEEEAAP